LIEQALRLTPHYPAFNAQQLGLAYRVMGRYEEAMAAYQRAVARNPDFLTAHTARLSSIAS
jgi:tetratricopeptide (TPR) repeat protein